MAMATAAASLLAPPSSSAAATCAGPSASSALFPTSVPSLRAYPRLLLAFRRPAAAAAGAAAVLEDSEEEEEYEAPVQFDDVNEDYEDGYGGRGPAFTAPTRPRTGKAAVPLKRDRTRSKRYLEIQKLRESKKEYDVPAALSLMKQVANTRFVVSIWMWCVLAGIVDHFLWDWLLGFNMQACARGKESARIRCYHLYS